jgi:hypothetical protein
MWETVAYGTVAVGTAAVGLNNTDAGAVLAPASSPPIQAALVYVELNAGSVRFRVDGGTPGTAYGGGFLGASDDYIWITGQNDLRNFKAVAANSTVDGILVVAFKR